MSLTRAAERFVWLLAIVSLGTWAVLRIDERVSARQQLDSFAAARDGRAKDTPDFSLWSPHAIDAWRAALKRPERPTIGVLRIARLGLEAPILEGTDDATLDRGVGHIEDSAHLDSNGNVGIAGHRDSFFRVLKDIAVGDTIGIETLSGSASYRVERTWLVQPEDVWVLDPTPSAALTLVTCYPFYYSGSAPQRFIVRAVRTGGGQATATRK
jgi:sortase A